MSKYAYNERTTKEAYAARRAVQKQAQRNYRNVARRARYDRFRARERSLASYRGSVHKGISSGFNVVGLIFVVLIAVAIIRIVANQQIVTFTGFLELLRGVPQISYDWLSFTVTDFGETFPYGFQWLGSIIDFFSDMFAVMLYSSTAVLNIFSVFFYFLRWLFVM